MNNYNQFIKEFLTPTITEGSTRNKWAHTPGLYQWLIDNSNALKNLFKIYVMKIDAPNSGINGQKNNVAWILIAVKLKSPYDHQEFERSLEINSDDEISVSSF